MAEAGCAPNAHVGGDISQLNQCGIDQQHPWTQSDWTGEEITMATNWMEAQQRLGGAPPNQLPGVDWQLLQGEQREVILKVVVELEADYQSYGSPAIAHKQAEHSAHKPIDQINL